MDDIIIYPKRKRMIMLSIVSLVFILLGAVFIGVAMVEDEKLLLTIGVFVALFFGLCLIFYLKIIFNPKPAVIITEEGIEDQSSYIAAGLVRWGEIESIGLSEFSGQLFLGIVTYDRQLIINRASGLKRLLNNLNRGLLETQVNIPVKNLAYPTEDLLEQIDTRMNNYFKTQITETE